VDVPEVADAALQDNSVLYSSPPAVNVELYVLGVYKVDPDILPPGCVQYRLLLPADSVVDEREGRRLSLAPVLALDLCRAKREEGTPLLPHKLIGGSAVPARHYLALDSVLGHWQDCVAFSTVQAAHLHLAWRQSKKI
jgi:hypothetical protein